MGKALVIKDADYSAYAIGQTAFNWEDVTTSFFQSHPVEQKYWNPDGAGKTTLKYFVSFVDFIPASEGEYRITINSGIGYRLLWNLGSSWSGVRRGSGRTEKITNNSKLVIYSKEILEMSDEGSDHWCITFGKDGTNLSPERLMQNVKIEKGNYGNV